MEVIRLFLVDDHMIVREGLKSLIEGQADMEVVGEANTGVDVWQQIDELQPDVVIMDISMPHMTGIEATRELKEYCPNVRVLVLSMHNDTNYLRQLLAVGASGYILKHTAADSLIQAVRVVAAGGTYLEPSLAEHVLAHYVQGTGVTSKVLGMSLSQREMEVVQRVAQGHSNKDIALQLVLSIKTVETYRARAMSKLGINGRVALVRYALEHGWLRTP
jgi:two-component system response regulator NreC